MPILIEPEEALQRMRALPAFLLIDVRKPHEYAAGHCPGAVLIEKDDILAGVAKGLPQDKSLPVFVYCRAGVRSAASAKWLEEAGYTAVHDIRGGWLALAPCLINGR